MFLIKKISLIFLLIFILITNFTFVQEAGSEKIQGAEDLINTGDSLYKKWAHQSALDKYQEAYQIAPENYEVVWKISRQYVKLGEKAPNEQKENLYERGMEWAKKAVSLNSNDAHGHLWLASAQGRLAMFKGGKQKVALSKEVKKEAEIALKLDSQSALACHILGVWHREVATLSFVLKVFAKIIYGGLPAADVQEAVNYLERAVALEPENIEHHLELGKSYIEIKKYDLAKKEFKQCLILSPTEENDSQYKKEAEELLEKIKRK